MGTTWQARCVVATWLGSTLIGCGHGECRVPRAPGSVADLVERDPARVDPQHYRVELENEHVRIVRTHYGPREEAAMHDHVCGRVIVNLNRQHEIMQSPDGKPTEVDHRAGEAKSACPR